MMDLNEKLNLRHTAVLVIDVQKDFVSPDGVLGKRGRDFSLINPMLDKLPTFIKAAKNAKVLTLYTQQIYDRSHLNALQLEQYDLDGKFVTCDVDTDGWHFHGITPPQDDVYPKYNYNVFSNPDLILRLQENNIKTLVIAGVDTYYCIETAIRNGFDLGYKIVVPKDLIACSGKRRAFHQHTLKLVDKTYGVVVTSEDIAKVWQSYN